MLSVIRADEMVFYLEKGLGATQVDEDGPRRAWDPRRCAVRQPRRDHRGAPSRSGHLALRRGHSRITGRSTSSNDENQTQLKGYIEGLGFTDVTEQKNRGYFMSTYNRTPSGALFEYAFSTPEGFLVDESIEELGTTVQIPPPFAHLADEMLAYLEPIEDRS